MSKSEEELVDEVKQWAGNLDAQNMETPQGRWFDKHVEAEETICPYCGINADKVIEHVKETYDQAHTAGKKARDEELLEVVEEMEHPEETMSQRRKGCGNHNAGYECCRNQALTEIKKHLTTDTQDNVCNCAYDGDDMQEKQENYKVSDCCRADVEKRGWPDFPGDGRPVTIHHICKSCGESCDAVEPTDKPDPIEEIKAITDKRLMKKINQIVNWINEQQ